MGVPPRGGCTLGSTGHPAPSTTPTDRHPGEQGGSAGPSPRRWMRPPAPATYPDGSSVPGNRVPVRGGGGGNRVPALDTGLGGGGG